MLGSYRDQIELIDVFVSDLSINNRSRKRVLESANITSKESGINSFLCIDIHELGFIETQAGESLLYLVDFGSADSLDLSLTNSVSVEDDLSWIGSIGFFEGFTSSTHTLTEVIGGLLTHIILNNTCRPVDGGRVVDRSTQSKNGLLTKISGVENIQTTDHGWLVHERQCIDSPGDTS